MPAAGNSETPAAGAGGRLIRVTMDRSFGTLSPLHEAERERAIADLQADAVFVPTLRGTAAPPGQDYALHLSVEENRLVFEIRQPDESPLIVHVLALGPFRSLMRDYRLLMASHEAAIEEGRDARLQAIDMGRRGLHDEGARLVARRLEGKIAIDFATARRLFTLICVLHERN
jgi:uncharacterized protein (UPF0262 family)